MEINNLHGIRNESRETVLASKKCKGFRRFAKWIENGTSPRMTRITRMDANRRVLNHGWAWMNTDLGSRGSAARERKHSGSACVSHALVSVPLTSPSARKSHHLATTHAAVSSRRDAENSGRDGRAPQNNGRDGHAPHFNRLDFTAKEKGSRAFERLPL